MLQSFPDLISYPRNTCYGAPCPKHHRGAVRTVRLITSQLTERITRRLLYISESLLSSVDELLQRVIKAASLVHERFDRGLTAAARTVSFASTAPGQMTPRRTGHLWWLVKGSLSARWSCPAASHWALSLATCKCIVLALTVSAIHSSVQRPSSATMSSFTLSYKCTLYSVNDSVQGGPKKLRQIFLAITLVNMDRF